MFQLTLAEIEKVDRHHHQLTPNLDYRHAEPNQFDRHYVYEDQTVCSENAISDDVKLELEPLKYERLDEGTGQFVEPIGDNTEIGDDFQIDISNSDDEQDVPIKQLIDARKAQKSNLKKSKLLKEGKSKKVYNKTKKKPSKTTKPKSKDVPETTVEATTKVTKAKSSKGDKETEKKMAEYFAVKVFTSLEEKLEEMQKRKLHSSYVNAPLKCEFCYQGFLDNVTFDVHMQKHTDVSSHEYQVNRCKAETYSKCRISRAVQGVRTMQRVLLLCWQSVKHGKFCCMYSRAVQIFSCHAGSSCSASILVQCRKFPSPFNFIFFRLR